MSFRATPWRQGHPEIPLFQVTKTYVVKKGVYSISMRLEFVNLTDKPAKIMFDQAGPTGLQKEDYTKDDRNVLYGQIDQKSPSKITLGMKTNAELQDTKNPFPGGERFLGSSDNPATQLVWLAADNKFFASSMYLMPRDASDLAWDGPGARFYYDEAAGANGQASLAILPAWFGLSKKWVLSDPTANFPANLKGLITLSVGNDKWVGTVEANTSDTITIGGWAGPQPGRDFTIIRQASHFPAACRLA